MAKARAHKTKIKVAIVINFFHSLKDERIYKSIKNEKMKTNQTKANKLQERLAIQ